MKRIILSLLLIFNITTGYSQIHRAPQKPDFTFILDSLNRKVNTKDSNTTFVTPQRLMDSLSALSAKMGGGTELVTPYNS